MLLNKRLFYSFLEKIDNGPHVAIYYCFLIELSQEKYFYNIMSWNSKCFKCSSV